MRALLFLVLALAGSLTGADLSIGGSTTVQSVLVEVAKCYQQAHGDVHINCGGGGSGAGIANAAAGAIDVGMASRALSDDERKAHPDLIATQIALDGIVMVCAAKSPVSGLTSGQVRDIYLGTIRNWHDLGGPDQAIVPIARAEGHGTGVVFAEYFKLEPVKQGEGAQAVWFMRDKNDNALGTAPLLNPVSNQDALAVVQTKPGALTFCSVAMVESLIAKGAALKILDLDGVPGSTTTVRSGAYSLRRPLLLLTRGQPKASAKDFIAYLLSPAGQQLVAQAGFIPVGTSAP